MAVRHLVSVFEGAPGPVHGAATAGASDTSPSSAGARERILVELSFFMEISLRDTPVEHEYRKVARGRGNSCTAALAGKLGDFRCLFSHSRESQRSFGV